MREIKFRVWDQKEKRMIVNAKEGVKIYLNGSISDKKGWGNQDLILQQFTGLHDKNGKEIYEGDVVKQENFPRPLFVKWDYDGFYLFENICNEASIDEKELEVIGNIFETP